MDGAVGGSVGRAGLRTAGPRDAVPLAALHRDCWAETYRGIADPTVLEPLLAGDDHWTALWRDRLDPTGKGPPTVVAETSDDRLVGFATLGPARMDDAPTPVELWALYTLAAQHGTGLGARLLAAALTDEPCMLWVTEANHRARAFYARHGFTADGTRQLYDGLGAWELRLVRDPRPEDRRAAPPAP